MLKKFHIDIPFVKPITQIPSYTKILKELLSTKKKLEETIPITCNTISENKLAQKCEDPRSFSIPYVIGIHVKEKALCDLGASVSLIPLSMYERPGLRKFKPTKMSL